MSLSRPPLVSPLKSCMRRSFTARPAAVMLVSFRRLPSILKFFKMPLLSCIKRIGKSRGEAVVSSDGYSLLRYPQILWVFGMENFD